MILIKLLAVLKCINTFGRSLVIDILLLVIVSLSYVVLKSFLLF